MSRTRVIIVTIGVMLSLFLASMESTVVATAMPTIVSQLGGLDSYSWVFAAYMLASTTMVPVFGKLSDIYGLRPVYLAAMGLFLVGSFLCGRAESMNELIAYRALQGLGAGGLLPLAFIMIGAIFTFEQRARMQGVFSGVWGVSSVVGPLLGGFLVDQVSWHWVFYSNLLPGIMAAALVWFALVEPQHDKSKARPPVDYAGVVLLSAGIVLLLLSLFELGTLQSWGLMAGALVCFGLLAWVEQRAADPIVPLKLFRSRMFAVACAHGVLTGCAMFGSVSYVPLFAQSVLGTTATGAGVTLMPLMLGWVFASIIGSRLLLRFDYRTLALIGTALLTTGGALLLPVGMGASSLQLLIPTTLMGIGMGLSIPAFLIAVQSSVERSSLGAATSTIQFTRSIGGTVGVSIMGVALSAALAANLVAAGVDPTSVSLNGLIDPLQGEATAVLNETIRVALANAMQSVFIITFVTAGLGLLITFLTPRGRIGQLTGRPAAPEAQASPEAEPTPAQPLSEVH